MTSLFQDKDLSETSSNMVQLTSKFQRVEQQNQEAKRTENELRRQVAEWKNKQKEIWKEYEHGKRKCSDFANNIQLFVIVI